MTNMDLSEFQMQIKLVTRQQTHAVPDVPLSVPTNIDTKALNKLVNELLKENNTIVKEVEFDFLVLGELLRLPLVEHLQDHDTSTEATIEIEYIERTPAPQPEDSLLHDDWVSSIQVADKWILTGCYDNSVNIWSIKGKHQASMKQHSNYIRSVSWLKKGDPLNGFVSSSHDLTAVLWDWNGSTDAQAKVVLKGHERGIDTVSVSPNSSRLVSGGWDTHLKIWSASLEQDDEEPPHKKNRGGLLVRTPLHTLKGHKECISGSEWLDNSTVATCSMDHTIKLWDAELCGIKNEVVGNKAFLGLSWSPLTNTLLTCSADRHIRLYDPRSSEGAMCKTMYTSHSSWVSAICWSNYDQHLFMSGGYDQCVKLWDSRCPKAPLYNLQGHQGKVLCVNWSNDKYLVSGGSDNSVNIFKNKNVMRK